MGDIVISVVGHIGTTVECKVTANGAHFTSFRLATTPRHWSKAQNGYVDEVTNWITVHCWRSLAVNAAKSLLRGQPVIVVGKLKTQEWVRDGVQRSRFILEATAVGHDLSRGVATFSKTPPLVESVPDHAAETVGAAAEIEARTPADLGEVIASGSDGAPFERQLADAS